MISSRSAMPRRLYPRARTRTRTAMIREGAIEALSHRGYRRTRERRPVVGSARVVGTRADGARRARARALVPPSLRSCRRSPAELDRDRAKRRTGAAERGPRSAPNALTISVSDAAGVAKHAAL